MNPENSRLKFTLSKNQLTGVLGTPVYKTLSLSGVLSGQTPYLSDYSRHQAQKSNKRRFARHQ